MLSVGSAFAADEDTTLTTIDDEITVEDDVLSVEDETDALEAENEQVLETDDATEVVGASATVTNTTFHNYFDEYGDLTSDADELIFEGDFTGIDVNYITIEKSVKLTGNNAIFNNVSFVISANNVVIDGFKLYMDNKDTSLISIGDSTNVTISNNIIDYKGLNYENGFAIFALDIDNLKLINNAITFVGNNESTYINNAIRIFGDEKKSTNIQIEGNTFDITIPSRTIDYSDYPNSLEFSDGVVLLGCENITINKNTMTINYNDFSGYSDTIKAILIGNSNYDFDEDDEIIYPNLCSNVIVADNNIVLNGHAYVYGISIAADNFNITGNDLSVSSVNYGAGFEICGFSNKGNISENTVNVTTPSAAYGVYAYPYGFPVDNMTYSKNKFTVSAYESCGMELVENNPVILDNIIIVTGNHTVGIVANMGDYGVISGNTISSLGTNIGHKPADPMIHIESTAISVNGDTLISGNDLTSTSIGINLVDYGDSGSIVVDGNKITVTANNDTVANYAIYSNYMDTLNVTNNNITFKGKSNGTTDSNAISIIGVDDVVISNNTIDATLTAGQGSAINMANCPDSTISENTIDFGYEGYANWGSNNVVFVQNGCDNVKIINNEINAVGSTYVYGITTYAQNFTIENNNVVVESDVNYACGINPDAGASGIVNKNDISVSGLGTVYGIYSGMWKGMSPVTVNYTNNVISGNGFFACGIELGGAKENAVANNITLEGNYTIGVALYKYGQDTIDSTIKGNDIASNGVSIGNASDSKYYDAVGIETTGIKIASGNVTISDNNVRTAGDYAINLCGSNATVADNYLAAKKTVGPNSIVNGENATISGSGPELKTIISAVDLYTTYGDGIYYVSLKDENGDPIKNATIFLTVDSEIINETTDDDGVATFLVDEWAAGDYIVDVSYKGNATYGPKSIKGFIQIEKRNSQIVAPTTVYALVTATKNGYTYTLTLKDDRGNGLAKETVTITFNGKTQTLTTDDLGVIKYKLVATKAGTQKLTVKFNSNDNYVASTLTATVKINKEATKLTAKKKTFKAKVKTKKYTVTLKDSKGKAIKKVKVTIKVKGKTYKAKTNAKGKAVFKIKNLKKKGTYKAKVTFAGNNLYKKVAKTVKITFKK